MKRYTAMFDALKRKNEGAFVPFAVLGDPSLKESLVVLRALVAGGADALELGIPFSDPVADGPTIQAASQRAIKAGATTNVCFQLIAQLRQDFPKLPIGLLVYANLLAAPGEETFYKKASEAGVDSVLVADVPIFESHTYVAHARTAGIDPVFIAPPGVSEDRLNRS
jgi:tryptophan synthase alpha chain